jgi:hypothetical protein
VADMTPKYFVGSKMKRDRSAWEADRGLDGL